MSHIVNPVLYRLGKNIYWNVLYPSNYRSTGMRLHLILNLTLLSIFRMLNFRVIKIFINVENYKFKLLIAGFRLTKLFKLTNDLEEINLFSYTIDPFMFPPIYFGNTRLNRITVAHKLHYFNAFMKNDWIGSYKLNANDSFGSLYNFEHNFTKNLMLISKWTAETAPIGMRRRLEPLIKYAVNLRFLIKKIFGESMILLALKNPRLYFFLVFKKIFIMAAQGLKILKRSGFRTWYRLFKASITPILKRLVKKNVLSLKKKKSFRSLSIFTKLYVDSHSIKNRETYLSGAKKKICASTSYLNDYSSELAMLIIVSLLKKQKLCMSSTLKLVILLLAKKVVKKTVDEFALFPKNFLKRSNLKKKILPLASKKNDLVRQKVNTRHVLLQKKKKIVNFSSRKAFFSFGSYLSSQLKIKPGSSLLKSVLRKQIDACFKKKKNYVSYKNFFVSLKKKKKIVLHLKSYFYVMWLSFKNNNSFYNWILKKKIYFKKRKAPVITDWLTDKLFNLDLSTKLSQMFSMNIQLTLYSFSDMLSNQQGYNFFKGVKGLIRSVFIAKKDRFELKIGLIISHFALFFRSPQSLATFIIGAIEYRRYHYQLIRPFSALLGLLKLSDYGLTGVKIGFYGRLNGRDRKFRYYIIKGAKPNLLSLGKNILDYAEAQAVTRYGIVHIHIWMYSKKNVDSL